MSRPEQHSRQALNNPSTPPALVHCFCKLPKDHFFPDFLAGAGFFAGLATALGLALTGLAGAFTAGFAFAALAGVSFPLAAFAGGLGASGFVASVFGALFGFASAAGFSAGGALAGAV